MVCTQWYPPLSRPKVVPSIDPHFFFCNAPERQVNAEPKSPILRVPSFARLATEDPIVSLDWLAVAPVPLLLRSQPSVRNHYASSPSRFKS